MTNRLKAETSPYLLQHAENPVDWFPWGAEAFSFARDQDKPIFLSVGYAACHWCHVMAHESFEDPETAAILNEHFVNIKVDREERPDIDTIYMDAVVAMTGQGGWPMSVFLTPQGEPFFGGTYFPPSPRHNMPAFRDLLLMISKQWHENRTDLVTTAAKLKEHIAATISLEPLEGQLDTTILTRAAEMLFKTYDWTNGGWGGAPKFPQASAIDFLLRKHHRDGDALALDMATHALHHMARGGLFDQLAGGFHRYTVDSSWLVPHFEKMLYDNALLAQTYLHAWQITGEDSFRHVVEKTLDFLLRDMRHRDGGFYSALDADSEGEEGKYYLWNQREIEEALEHEDLTNLFIHAFGVSAAGNFEGKNILYRPLGEQELLDHYRLTQEELAEKLGRARERLLDVRRQRIPPTTDDKVITAWNGLLLAALAEAGRALNNPHYLEAAQTLAAFALETLIVDGVLRRAWREQPSPYRAYLDDHAALGLGLLALYQADFNTRWIQAANSLGEQIQAQFTDPEGGFFDTSNAHETLIARPKSLQDSPLPSGNALAISLLLKLAALQGESQFVQSAEQVMKGVQNMAVRYPTSFAAWLANIDFALGPQIQLAIIGDPVDARFNALMDVVRTRFLPNLVLAGAPETFDGVPSLLEGRTMKDEIPTAYLCQGFVCKAPTTSPEELNNQIHEALSAA